MKMSQAIHLLYKIPITILIFGENGKKKSYFLVTIIYTLNQTLACFVLYLIIITTFLNTNICILQ